MHSGCRFFGFFAYRADQSADISQNYEPTGRPVEAMSKDVIKG